MNPLDFHAYAAESSGRDIAEISPLAAELLRIMEESAGEASLPEGVGSATDKLSDEARMDLELSNQLEAAIAGAEAAIAAADNINTAPKMLRQLYETTGDYAYVDQAKARLRASTMTGNMLARMYVEVAQYANDPQFTNEALELVKARLEEGDRGSEYSKLAGVFAGSGDLVTARQLVDNINEVSGYRVLALQGIAVATQDPAVFQEALVLATAPYLQWGSRKEMLVDLAIASGDTAIAELARREVMMLDGGKGSSYRIEDILNLHTVLGEDSLLDTALTMAREATLVSNHDDKIRSFAMLIKGTPDDRFLDEATQELNKFLLTVDWAEYMFRTDEGPVLIIIEAIAKFGDIDHALELIQQLPNTLHGRAIAAVVPYIAKHRSFDEAVTYMEEIESSGNPGFHYRTEAFLGIAKVIKEKIAAVVRT